MFTRICPFRKKNVHKKSLSTRSLHPLFLQTSLKYFHCLLASKAWVKFPNNKSQEWFRLNKTEIVTKLRITQRFPGPQAAPYGSPMDKNIYDPPMAKNIKALPIWNFFIYFESIWSILNNSEPFWYNLIKFEQVWSILNKYDPVWTCLSKFDRFGSILNQFDPF